jgi:hypothetical protein
MGWPKTFVGTMAGIMLASAAAAQEVVQAFDAQVPFPPAIADSTGSPQLAYELHLTNFSRLPIEIEQVAVVDSASGTVIADADGDELATWMGRPGGQAVKSEIRTIQPGMRGMVYFNIPLGAVAPRKVAHRIRFRLAGDQAGASQTLTAAESSVSPIAPIALGPPLRGGPWAAVYAPEMERGHRRVVYATEGAARIPGRFAIDWMRIDNQGLKAPPGATRLDAFYGHGSEVLAVADATVAAVRDDMAEPQTIDAIPKVSIGDASGNYVALDLGRGRYAFYEHLQRGIRVRPGQRVKRGEVIGKVGLTGSGSMPHLHFHVADANSLLGAEGLPFTIDRVAFIGSYSSIEEFGRGGPWTPFSGRQAAGPSTPGPNMVVRFRE